MVPVLSLTPCAAASLSQGQTAVTADGRISPGDMGIWSDEHIEPLARSTTRAR